MLYCMRAQFWAETMDKQVFSRGIFLSPDTPEEQLTPTRATPSHSELPPHTYSSLPALICMCRRSHDFPPKHIHKCHGHCKNWGIFLVYVLHLSDCLYIYFYYCVFVLKSCSRKPYLQSEIHTDGSVHAL